MTFIGPASNKNKSASGLSDSCNSGMSPFYIGSHILRQTAGPFGSVWSAQCQEPQGLGTKSGAPDFSMGPLGISLGGPMANTMCWLQMPAAGEHPLAKGVLGFEE